MCDHWDSVSNYSTHVELFVSSCESSEWEDDDYSFQNCFAMSGSATDVVLGTTPKLGRRSMALADIDPKYVSQSGIWEASEVETSRGSIRIQHLTAVSNAVGPRPLSTSSGSGFQGHYVGNVCPGIATSRFPKLEECAHFHYDIVELPHLKFALREDQVQRCLTTSCITGNSDEHVGGRDKDKQSNFSIEVVSGGQCWIIRRTILNLIKLDEQLHRCVWDRNFSILENLDSALREPEENESSHVIHQYLERLTSLPTNQITCGSVLSWLEIDNRGRHIISSDDAALNTPAVAAALATRTYTAQAQDELSFRVGEMISVIDMPPPEESIWLRGKLTRESHEMGINFEVGFFPREFVEIIGEKGKFQSGLTSVQTTRKLTKLSVTSTTSSPIPDKPVLRKHGKIISFFRSMMSRPEKRVLQQKGILRERVFNCDLAEHLLNTGTEIPIILKTCAQFIELYGISDGIYRVSGSLRNTQRLRRLFDADEVPNLVEDEGIRQDVHAVSSVLKQYFRELPNPLCTYQLYEKFVLAISPPSNRERFDKIKEVIKELPPPHYRTLEYLMLHLSKMTIYSDHTGMTAQNMAIVWAPNLIRCRDLEGGSAAEFKGVSNHVIVTEFVIRYAERFFGKDKSPVPSSENTVESTNGRPESLLLSSSSCMKLMSLEAAKEKLGRDRSYIEVGGGPSSLPPIYHTVIDTSKRRTGLKSKGPMGAPGGWKNFFSRNRSFSKGQRKTTASDIRVVMNTAMNLKDGTVPGFGNKLRPVRSEESLTSSPYDTPTGGYGCGTLENTLEVDESEEAEERQHSTSSPASPVSDAYSLTFHTVGESLTGSTNHQQQYLDNTKTHNRSISHDSYFEKSMKRLGVIPKEILEEESSVRNSRLSLEISSPEDESPEKERSSGIYGDSESSSSVATKNRSSFSSLFIPLPLPSLRPSHLPITLGGISSTTDDSPREIQSVQVHIERFTHSIPNSPVLRPKPKPRLSKLRDCQVQTSLTAVNDVGVSTVDEGHFLFSLSQPVDRVLMVHKQIISELDVYQYPTFNGTEKEEITQSAEYEIDRNSSIDESSTDTTPRGEPYGVTNILYSPLVNEISTPPEPSSSSDDEPCTVEMSSAGTDKSHSVLLVCPSRISTKLNTNDESLQPQYENLIPIPRNHKYDDIILSTQTPITQIFSSVSKNEADGEHGNNYHSPTLTSDSELGENRHEEMHVQHYENLECLREFIQGKLFPDSQASSSIDNFSLSNIYEDLPATSSETKQSFEDVDLHQRHSNSFTEQPVDEFTTYVSGSVNFNSRTVNNELDIKNFYHREIIQVRDKWEVGESSTEVEIEGTNSREHCNQNISRSNIWGEEESIGESVNITWLEIKDSIPPDSPEDDSVPTSSLTEESEEIRHIDSPLVVDNPLYAFQSMDIDTEYMSEEVKKMSQDYKNEYNRKKLVSRCNSAPLTDEDFSLTLQRPGEIGIGNKDSSLELNSLEKERNKNRKISRTSSAMVHEEQKSLLSKRLSEPSLNMGKSEDNKGSWKQVDAKRLSHRKQSVKELLTKFEGTTSQESISPAQSPTRACGVNNNNNNNNNNDTSVPTTNSNSIGSGGLSKLSFKSTSESTEVSSCLRDRNNSRHQHHRFSMGDILMSQSLNSSSEENSTKESSLTMTRSDTFPELRNESTKENESGRLDYSDKRSITVPDKMLQVFEVANTIVDNNDPHTRERIEKYKNNRRLFLREKYSGVGGSESESFPSLSSFKSLSTTSTEAVGTERESSSSVDSVFTVPSGLTGCPLVESPRKRALSEDVSHHLSQNQFKTFKSEGEEPVSSTLSLPEKRTQRSISQIGTSRLTSEGTKSCSSSSTSKTLDSHHHPPLGSSSRLNIKGSAVGTRPTEVISVTTTVTTVEVPTKGHWTTSLRPPPHGLETGKKIKDIAAFFERKQF